MNVYIGQKQTKYVPKGGVTWTLKTASLTVDPRDLASMGHGTELPTPELSKPGDMMLIHQLRSFINRSSGRHNAMCTVVNNVKMLYTGVGGGGGSINCQKWGYVTPENDLSILFLWVRRTTTLRQFLGGS